MGKDFNNGLYLKLYESESFHRRWYREISQVPPPKETAQPPLTGGMMAISLPAGTSSDSSE